MEAQVSLTVAFSSSACFGLLFLISLFTIPNRLANVDFRSDVKKHNGPTPADDIAPGQQSSSSSP